MKNGGPRFAICSAGSVLVAAFLTCVDRPIDSSQDQNKVDPARAYFEQITKLKELISREMADDSADEMPNRFDVPEEWLVEGGTYEAAVRGLRERLAEKDESK